MSEPEQPAVSWSEVVAAKVCVGEAAWMLRKNHANEFADALESSFNALLTRLQSTASGPAEGGEG